MGEPKKIKVNQLKKGVRILGADGNPTRVTDIYPVCWGPARLVWLELANGQSGAREFGDTVVKA